MNQFMALDTTSSFGGGLNDHHAVGVRRFYRGAVFHLLPAPEQKEEEGS